MATNNAINLKSSGIASYDGAGTFSALANPLTVSNGGYGVSSNTAYSVLCAGTTSTGAVQSVSGVGTSGQVLTSNGASALPTWQAAPAAAKNVISFHCLAGNPADSTTYFLSTGQALTANTSSGNANTRVYVSMAGTITKAYGVATCTTGSSTSVTVALYINETTTVNLTTSLSLAASPATFNNTGLSQAVAIGDEIECKIVCPAWPTNPTNVYFSVYLLIT